MFDAARASCQADDGDLLMVKDNDIRLYLKDIMLSVYTGTLNIVGTLILVCQTSSC